MLLSRLLNSLGSGMTLGRDHGFKLLVNGLYLILDGVFGRNRVFGRNTINISSEMLAFLQILCLVKFKMPFWKIICLIKDLTRSLVKLEAIMILRKEERSVTGLYPRKVGTKTTLMVWPKVTHELREVEG